MRGVRRTSAAIVTVGILCWGQSPFADPAVPQGITIPTDAKDLKVKRGYGEAIIVNYEVRRQFPAHSFLDELRSTLEKAGFKAGPLNSVNHWNSWVDRHAKPNISHYQWFTAWKDAAGNEIMYMVDYRSPYDPAIGLRESPENDRISVAVLWIPASQVETSERTFSN